jgi:hypothetical protein
LWITLNCEYVYFILLFCSSIFIFHPFNFSSINIVHPCARGIIFLHVTKYFVPCVSKIFLKTQSCSPVHIHATRSPNSNPQNLGHLLGTSISSLPHYFNINAGHLTSSSKVSFLGHRPNLWIPQSGHFPRTHPFLCHLKSWDYVQITKV